TVTAVYGGDDSYQSSTSAPVMVTINYYPINVPLTSSAAQAAAGQPVTFASAGLSFSANGTVTFYDRGTALGSAHPQWDGSTLTAALTTSVLAVGSHSITAVYDDGHSRGTSAPLTETVTATPPTAPANLGRVASALTHSFEFYANFITAAYQRYLGRTTNAM